MGGSITKRVGGKVTGKKKGQILFIKRQHLVEE